MQKKERESPSKKNIRFSVRPLCNFVVLRGSRSVTVYECRKILHYAPDAIRLRIGNGEILSVEGERLCCTAFSAGTVTVEGVIRSVRYPEENEA